LASTGEDQAVFIWDTWSDEQGEPWSLFEDRRGVPTPHLKNGPLRDLAFDAQGRLATASEDGTVWAHDLGPRAAQRGPPRRRAEQGGGAGRGGRAHAVAFHPLRDAMVIGTSTGRLIWVELQDGEPSPRELTRAPSAAPDHTLAEPACWQSKPEHQGAVWSVAF